METSDDPGASPTLLGWLDFGTRERIAGWAQDTSAPEIPVSLVISADDEFVARVLANRFRSDLLQAGIGGGRHGFDITLNGVLPLGGHLLAVRREEDGTHLLGSPILVPPVSRFDQATRDQFAALIAEAIDDVDLDERLSFLTSQVEVLLQKRAHRRGWSAEKAGHQQLISRWTGAEDVGLGDTSPRPPAIPLRALFVDVRQPVPSRDAGSNAVLSHMKAMRRLGFEVNFVSADMSADEAGELDRLGIACCHRPWYCSVEEVLQREAGRFDLVYLHRVSVAARYLELVRYHQPRTRLIYSVADLHHLRLARQAKAEPRPELLALARRFQTQEARAAAAADAVITHSTYEAGVLRRLVPDARIHVVPWSLTPRPTLVPFANRHDIAFIAHYGHAPNLDAARWLIDEIIPRVRELAPEIACLLVGSDLPNALRGDHPGIRVIGQVDSLDEVFDRVRLTVAPLKYGAGVKGKVLDSLAAGVPCVCTPVAAEGLELPLLLRELIVDDAAGFAAGIVRLHADETLNTVCREAGLNYVSTALSEPRIDGLLRDAARLPSGERGFSVPRNPGS